MNNFIVKQNINAVEFLYNNHIFLKRTKIELKTNNGKTYSFPITVINNKIHASLGKFGIYTETISSQNNLHCGEISIKLHSQEAFILYCPFEFDKTKETPYFQIPGFLYGTNNAQGSQGKQPKFEYGGKIGWPTSSKLYTRADRSTHNCVITIHNNLVFSVGIQEKLHDIEYTPENDWENKFAYNGLMLDSSDNQKNVIGFTIGYEHFPKRYSWIWDDPKTPSADEYTHGWIHGQYKKTITTTSYYFVDTAKHGIPEYGKAIEAIYHTIHEYPLKRATRIQAMQLCIDAIIEHGWVQNDSYFFLSDNSDEGKERGNTAWTGGMQVAYPILKAGIKLQNNSYIHIAKTYIQNLINNGINEQAQLFYEEFREGSWRVDGWWGQREDTYNWGDSPLHSGYVNGQASYYLLKSYETTQNKHIDWLHTAQKIIQTAIRSQRSDGALGKFYNPNTGDAVAYDGFQSCWFVAAIAKLAAIQNDNTLLKIAEKSIDYYYQFHVHGELFGTPMDTHEAVDEEGNLAFIIACVELHKITQNQKYITYAIIGLNYEFSWKFPYNTAFSNEPLRSMNWCSCGGSVTSTHNPHIHPMGNLIAGEIYYLYQHTKSPYIKSRLKDTCIWGLSTFNTFDSEFGFGKKGYCTEQFFHSDALILPWWKKWDGGIWEAYLPWASGCVILNAAEDIPDTFFE